MGGWNLWAGHRHLAANDLVAAALVVPGLTRPTGE